MYGSGIASKQKAEVIVGLISFVSFLLRNNPMLPAVQCLTQVVSCILSGFLVAYNRIASLIAIFLHGQMWKARNTDLSACKEPNVLIQNQLGPLFYEL